MSKPGMTLRDVMGTLQAEDLLDEDTARNYLEKRADQQPWYVRTMVGFGAWLASLLLIGFVASFTLLMEGGHAFIGLVLVIGAVLLRRRFGNDFLVQCALASSLAGQALFAYGFSETVGHEEFEIFLGFVLVVSSVLFFLFPDRIHRVLMVLLATGSLTALCYVWELNAFVPLLGPALVAAMLLLHERLPNLLATRFAPLAAPLMSGLMLGAFGVLSISTVYVLPELGLEQTLYPRPWISTILLGGLFVYVGTLIWPAVVPHDTKGARPFLYGAMAIVSACAWAAPGLLLGLIVVILGAASGRKTFTGAGVGFFVVFLAAYFYGIEVTMLTKSVVLVATGVAVLILRWAVLGVASTPEARGLDHA